MNPVISVSNLQKSFGKVNVLQGVTFDVPKGSIFALLGSNGAGKTTAVRILSTLSLPNGGTASLCGYDVVKNPQEVRSCISLTGQFAAVDEVLTGRENLELIGQLKRMPNPKTSAQEWLATFDLEEAADRQAKTYSGGMRRRLDIAMSLMGKPEVLFLDEPTTGLDPQNRLAMWELVKGLANSGTTIFLTTQYLEEAEQLADNIAILHQGIIIAQGTPSELKEKMPQGGANLNFGNEKEAQRAMNLLREHGFAVDGLSPNLPSLEDVFLTMIGEKKDGISTEMEQNND